MRWRRVLAVSIQCRGRKIYKWNTSKRSHASAAYEVYKKWDLRDFLQATRRAMLFQNHNIMQVLQKHTFSHKASIAAFAHETIRIGHWILFHTSECTMLRDSIYYMI